uniref:Syndecan binding protein 2 n=1 Tax=Dromaius novaehollandiae TaxID=8790 RepID=A0A8C4P439_DRONO
ISIQWLEEDFGGWMLLHAQPCSPSSLALPAAGIHGSDQPGPEKAGVFQRLSLRPGCRCFLRFALVAAGPAPGQLVAPLSGSDAGLRRAAIKPGLREIHLCKDERGKTGLKLKNVDQGIFVQLVKANSPAALVGLRFGDQVLQLDGKSCAGWSSDKAQRALKKASPEKIVMVVRDRPFQRTVTMHKDSSGHVGFVVRKGQIVSLAKDGSAARNGLLTHHYVCEVNGQNVIGLKDKELMEVLAGTGRVVTLTIIPAVIYEHMAKATMDRSLPDL